MKQGMKKLYIMEDSWLKTCKPIEDPNGVFSKNSSERSFIVQQFEKQGTKQDQQQFTFMSRKKKPPRPSNLSTISQDASILHNRSIFQHVEKKKSEMLDLLDKSRKQSVACFKKILNISVSQKKPIKNKSVNRQSLPVRGKSLSKLDRPRPKSLLKSCCYSITPLSQFQAKTPCSRSNMHTLTSSNKENSRTLNETCRLVARKQQLQRQLKQINESLLMKKKSKKKKKV